jgi:hypothetical protein|tara:strand:+ start:1077 stop:1442 length:366 start_codon:yes stop_codon:yes gene_type:complete
MAFKMKGTPMYRNYGIGTPMKKGKPVPGATDELLKGLGAMGTGSAVDPKVVKDNRAEATRGVQTPEGYNNMSSDERQVARKNMAPDIERNNARVDRVVARKVTNQDVASQAKSRARAKNRG